MECRKITDLLSGYLDGVLDPEEKTIVSNHLRECYHCRHELASLQEVSKLLREKGEVLPPPEFRGRLMARIAQESGGLASGEALASETGAGERDETRDVTERGGLSQATKGTGKFARWKGKGLGAGFGATLAAAALLVMALGLGSIFNSSGIFGPAGLHSYGDFPAPAADNGTRVELEKRQAANEDLAVGGAEGVPGERGIGVTGNTAAKSLVADQSLPPESQIEEKAGGEATKQLPPYQRKIIKSGRVELEVSNYLKAGQQVEFLADAAGGYIESMTTEVLDRDKRAGYYTLRIPAARFNETLAKIKALGKVKTETLNGADVTQEYNDTEARMRNLKKQELRLLELLGQAKDLSDVLTLENELNRVRTEIEGLEGRLRYLDNVVAMATLQVEIREKGAGKPEGPSPFAGIWQKVGERFLESAGNLLLFLAWVLPNLILLGLLGWGIYLVVKLKRR